MTANAATSRRRTASRRVSDAIVRTAFICPPPAPYSRFPQQLEEALFQALLLGYDRLDPAAERDDRGHELRHPPGRHLLDQQPVSLLAPAAEVCQAPPPAAGQAGHPQPGAGPADLQLGQRPGGK